MGKGKGIQVGNVDADEGLLKAQAEIYNHLFAYAVTFALRSAVELHIADIIHAHGHPMSISQIASKLESPSPDVTCLARVMRLLVRRKIFTIDYNNQSSIGEDYEQDAKYGLTTISKCLLHDQGLNLAPMVLFLSCHTTIKAWYEITSLIKEGINPFVKAHGESVFEYKSYKNPDYNNVFNRGMAAITKPTLDAVMKGYKVGFSKLEGTLVDVAGGLGNLVAKIVEVYPHIKGINFDLPQVVANAPQYPGVTHVCGDIFQEIPMGDNIIIKTVLHDWPDEECLTILKNCKKAISQKNGKVIIVDAILHPNRHEMFDDATIALDLLMMTNSSGGKERTEGEWRKLLNNAGFAHINVIPLQTIMSLSIIEAF